MKPRMRKGAGEGLDREQEGATPSRRADPRAGRGSGGRAPAGGLILSVLLASFALGGLVAEAVPAWKRG